MNLFDKMRSFIEHVTAIEIIISTDGISWSTKYDLVFKHIFPDITELGFKVDWGGDAWGDASYEDDVRAYYSAVAEKADEFQALIEKIIKS